MYYRTRTYLAGDWDGDRNLIQTIKDWNKNGHLALDFTDAHDLMQARDGSLNCSIKESLSKRLNASKTFVLIVGEKTNSVTSGSCKYCKNYNSTYQYCTHNKSVDYRSYIKYECDKAERDSRDGSMHIVVIYNSMYVYKDRCPESVRNIGTHVAGIHRDAYGRAEYDYQTIKKAIMG